MKKSTKNLAVILLLFYLTVFFFLMRNSLSYLDPDLGWHLKTGREIMVQKGLPVVVDNNFVLNGESWIDHEWLMNIAAYLVYQNYGYLALNLLFALLVILALLIVIATVYWLVESGNNIFYLLLFTLIGTLGMAPHLGVRIQEISILNLSVVCFVLFHYTKYSNFRILFFLPPLFYFWACAHAGFLIGLFVLALWLAIKFLELLLTKTKSKLYFVDFSKSLSGKKFMVASAFVVSCFLATLITPYGTAIYKFLLSYGNTYYLLHIQEWLPFYYLPIEYKKLIYYALVVVALMLSFYLSLSRKVKEAERGEIAFYKIDLWLIISSLVFLFLAAKANRNFPLLVIISLPFLVNFFSSYLNLSHDFIHKRFGQYVFLIYFYLIAGLLLAGLANSVKTNFITDPFADFCSTYPCGAVTFLENHPEYLSLNMLNEFDYGGYLLWRLPSSQLFIDGRFPQYLFNGQTILETYNQFFEQNETEKKLNQYKIGLVLLKRDQPTKLNWFEQDVLLIDLKRRQAKKNYLLDYLTTNSEWQGVYFDANSLVYVKL